MAVRRKRNLLDGVLTDSESAVCVLDGERKLRFFGPGMVKLTGWPADDMEGMICEPATSSYSPPMELLASTLAPPHAVLSGSVFTVAAVLPHRDGTSVKTTVTFVPILDQYGAVTRIVVMSGPESSSAVPASISQKLHAEITALRVEFRRRFSEGSFIGRCPMIRKALRKAEMLANSDAGYSVVGPAGSGRRHLARLIHTSGMRHHEQSFVALDCQLLTPEQVLETLRRIRRLSTEHTTPHQQAGTLLFVDADRCPREVQSWILDNFSAEASGVRLAATSQRSLNSRDDEQWLMPQFNDLFSTMQIDLPSLHHRDDDVSILAQHFVEECHRGLETSAESLDEETLAELSFYRWPGNVRELRQVIREACQSCFDATISTKHLPFSFRAGVEAQRLPLTPQAGVQSLEAILVRFEADVLTGTLASCDGNKAEAARRLGLTRPKLYRRLKTLGLDAYSSDSSCDENYKSEDDGHA